MRMPVSKILHVDDDDERMEEGHTRSDRVMVEGKDNRALDTMFLFVAALIDRALGMKQRSPVI